MDAFTIGSLGKRLLKTRLLAKSGNSPSFRQAIFRSFLVFLSGFSLGVPLFSGFHDFMTQTKISYERR
jgi:uncharacterized RDD family membrane protein YckC